MQSGEGGRVTRNSLKRLPSSSNIKGSGSISNLCVNEPDSEELPYTPSKDLEENSEDSEDVSFYFDEDESFQAKEPEGNFIKDGDLPEMSVTPKDDSFADILTVSIKVSSLPDYVSSCLCQLLLNYFCVWFFFLVLFTLQPWYKQCKDFLDDLNQNENAEPFKYPVDTDELKVKHGLNNN